jgi:hypothetical protein
MACQVNMISSVVLLPKNKTPSNCGYLFSPGKTWRPFKVPNVPRNADTLRWIQVWTVLVGTVAPLHCSDRIVGRRVDAGFAQEAGDEGFETMTRASLFRG